MHSFSCRSVLALASSIFLGLHLTVAFKFATQEEGGTEDLCGHASLTISYQKRIDILPAGSRLIREAAFLISYWERVSTGPGVDRRLDINSDGSGALPETVREIQLSF